VATGVHYPTPIHRQPAYTHLGLGPGALPRAERSSARVLSLPLHPDLTNAQVSRVAGALLAATRGRW
jgi:dTDP-4-amino-4,6-dideoxygalactose transaminase